jgi:very-short-patch-repair endonuclease
VTTVPRTLFDLGGEAHRQQLRRAVNQADREGRLNHRAIAELLGRHPRRQGTKALRAVLAAVDPQAHRTRSDLEADFLGLCRRFKLPTPVANAEIEGYEVDMHFPGTNLIVELDSYEYHRTPAEFAADRRKDAHLKTCGYEVLRVADSWLNSDPAAVAATIRKLLLT